MPDNVVGQNAPPEILANQISVALEGSAIEQLWHCDTDGRNYIINLAWAYYQRRYCQEAKFMNANIGPIDNSKLPYLKKDFTGVNLAANPPDPAEY
jgi:hypothetical protein